MEPSQLPQLVAAASPEVFPIEEVLFLLLLALMPLNPLQYVLLAGPQVRGWGGFGVFCGVAAFTSFTVFVIPRNSFMQVLPEEATMLVLFDPLTCQALLQLSGMMYLGRSRKVLIVRITYPSLMVFFFFLKLKVIFFIFYFI